MALTVREQVSLSGYTTLGVGGPAARFIDAGTDDQVIAEVRDADATGEPVLVLGGGSNLVVADEGFPGTVVHVATTGVRTDPGRDGGVTVAVAAGEDWDRMVERCVAEGLSGIECLSGIPGLAGATPIQNVGAYGQEVSETVVAVRAYDRLRDSTVTLANAECGFGYRTSSFKRSVGPQRGRVEHRVDEERADAAGVRIGRIDHHALALPELDHGRPDLGALRLVADVDAERGGQFGVPDRGGPGLLREPEAHREDDGGPQR